MKRLALRIRPAGPALALLVAAAAGCALPSLSSRADLAVQSPSDRQPPASSQQPATNDQPPEQQPIALTSHQLRHPTYDFRYTQQFGRPPTRSGNCSFG